VAPTCHQPMVMFAFGVLCFAAGFLTFDWLDSMPRPPTSWHLRYSSLVTLLALVFSVTLPLYLKVRMWYKVWLDAATKRAFEQVDSDRSGCINAKELYSSVLALYLNLNQYGLFVVSPERPVVDQIMKDIDAKGNGNGTLDFEEFAHAMQVLTAGAASRVATTVALTAMCPLAASYIVSTIAAAWTAAAFDADTFPLWLWKALELIPGWLPETLLSTLMLMLRPFAQDAVAALVSTPAQRAKSP